MKYSPPSLSGLALPPGGRPSPGAATWLRPLVRYCSALLEFSALLRPRTGALRLFVAALLLVSAGSSFSASHYVNAKSTNATPPYTNWATAARYIQHAVEASLAGDEIVVTNGVYPEVEVSKQVSVRSINGPQSTLINGSVRCVYLTNGASLSGFIVTGGYTDYAAGIWCASSTAIVSNCVITGNSAVGYGATAGGVYGGTLYDCVVTGNSATEGGYGISSGGGAVFCTLNNCIISNNYVSNTLGGYPGFATHARGGGADTCTLNNCTLSGNYVNNMAGDAVGGGASYCVLANCTLVANGAETGGGAYGSTLNNCTILGNSATYAGGVSGGGLNNCIVYSNTATAAWANHDDGAMNYCCTTPMPTGIGNITNEPMLMDYVYGNLRLQSNSPCINAGNNTYVPVGPDLDGNPRVAGGTVDIGAYEFQVPASGISYAWLQQYGLPINSSSDTADPDGDAVDNYHEWLAGTDPLNRFSSPAQLAVFASGTNLVVTWSTNAVGFTLQSAADLGPQALWTTNAPGPVVIGGQNIVTNPASGQRQFFRLTQ